MGWIHFKEFNHSVFVNTTKILEVDITTPINMSEELYVYFLIKNTSDTKIIKAGLKLFNYKEFFEEAIKRMAEEKIFEKEFEMLKTDPLFIEAQDYMDDFSISNFLMDKIDIRKKGIKIDRIAFETVWLKATEMSEKEIVLFDEENEKLQPLFETLRETVKQILYENIKVQLDEYFKKKGVEQYE